MSIELSLCQILCSTCRILPQAQRATGEGGGSKRTIRGGGKLSRRRRRENGLKIIIVKKQPMIQTHSVEDPVWQLLIDVWP